MGLLFFLSSTLRTGFNMAGKPEMGNDTARECSNKSPVVLLWVVRMGSLNFLERVLEMPHCFSFSVFKFIFVSATKDSHGVFVLGIFKSLLL